MPERKADLTFDSLEGFRISFGSNLISITLPDDLRVSSASTYKIPKTKPGGKKGGKKRGGKKGSRKR